MSPSQRGLILGTLAVLAVASVSALSGYLLFRWLDAPAPLAQPSAALVAASEFGGPWTLTDQHGQRQSDQTMHGRYLLIYFGYTYCPDVCPTELAAMAATIDLLGPDAASVEPLFITIDPERDTVEKLKAYVASFHPRLVGLTGSAEEVAAAARSFRVYYKRAGEGPDYAMDHTGYLYLVGPDGKGRAVFRPGAAPAELARLVRAELKG